MKFKSVAEAFNYYRTQAIDDMQKRAVEIGKEIDSNPDADIEALNIELRGIKEARENREMRNEAKKLRVSIEDMDFGGGYKDLTEDNVFESKEYRSAFYKLLLGQRLNDIETRAYDFGREVAEKRADAYNISSNSAAVLPTTTLNEIIKKARTMGGLLGECRAFSIPSKISVPVGTPSARAAWHTEAAAVESENVTVVSVNFDGNELIKLFSISEKVRKMSIDAFEAYLVEELSDCIMESLDYAVVNGSGSGDGTGIETGITWTTSGANKNHHQIAKSASFTYTDIVTFVALLKRGYAAGAKMAMNNATLYTVFYGMLDGAQRPIFVADPKDESVGKVLGFPVVIDDNIADNTVYLGNFGKYYGYNMPEGIVIEASRESSFKKGVVDYRAMAIADCKPLVSEAFVKLSKATA